jgi:hypothetical protein
VNHANVPGLASSSISTSLLQHTNRREKAFDRGAVIEPQIRLHPLREMSFFLNFACSTDFPPENTEIRFRKYFWQGGGSVRLQPTF